jgi:hypothetical protein
VKILLRIARNFVLSKYVLGNVYANLPTNAAAQPFRRTAKHFTREKRKIARAFEKELHSPFCYATKRMSRYETKWTANIHRASARFCAKFQSSRQFSRQFTTPRTAYGIPKTR